MEVPRNQLRKVWWNMAIKEEDFQELRDELNEDLKKRGRRTFEEMEKDADEMFFKAIDFVNRKKKKDEEEK